MSILRTGGWEKQNLCPKPSADPKQEASNPQRARRPAQSSASMGRQKIQLYRCLIFPSPQTATPKHPLPQLISQGSGRSPSAALINEAEEADLKEEPYGGIFLSVLLPRLAPKAPTAPADVPDGSGARGTESRTSFVPSCHQRDRWRARYPPHSGASTALKGWSPCRG